MPAGVTIIRQMDEEIVSINSIDSFYYTTNPVYLLLGIRHQITVVDSV